MNVIQSIAAKLGQVETNGKKKDPRFSGFGATNDSDARDAIADLASEYLPSGSGFDSGSNVDIEESTPDRVVIRTSFHHMNDCGIYTKWTEHRVIVTPSIRFGIEIRVTGKDYNGIKDYIGDVFSHALNEEIH